MKNKIFCSKCKKEYFDQWWLCPSCGAGLDAENFLVKNRLVKSMGEGNTPLICLEKLSSRLDCDLWAKCEYQNPTGSFKDRGSMVEIEKALELGKNGIVCASTGNMAASLSAYAARNNLKCKVVIPEKTSESKLKQAIACGAILVKVDGTYDECVGLAKSIANKENFFLCGDYLLRRQGQQSIGLELADKNFESFVVPIGNGNVGVAIAKGLKGVKFIGVKAKNRETKALAIKVRNPLDKYLISEWVKKTNGLLVTVTDKEIFEAQKILAKEEGLYVESAAAATLAGLLKMKENIKGQKIVLILTGSGLKD